MTISKEIGHNNNASAAIRKSAAVLSVILGVVYLFAFDSFGTPWKDELFQALCVRDPKSAPEGLLTFCIGHAWCGIFGFSIISLRMLASLFEFLSMSLCAVTMWRMTGNRLLSALSFLTGCVLLRTETFAIYNWDICSYLFDAMAMCLLVSCFRRPSVWKTAALGCAIALATAARVPSVAMLPAAMLVTGIFYYKMNRGIRRALAAPALILLSWTAAMLILASLMAGGPVAYVRLFTEGSVVSGHSFSDTNTLLYRFNWIAMRQPIYWFGSAGCVLIPLILTRLRYRRGSDEGSGNPTRNRRIAIVIIVAWIAISALPLLYNQLYEYSNSNRLDFILGACVPIAVGLLLLLPARNLVSGGKSVSSDVSGQLWSIAAILICMCVGSDAYLQRMAVGFSLPLIIGVIWCASTPGIRRYLRVMLIFTAAVYTSLLTAHYSHLIYKMHDKKYEQAGPLAGLHTESFIGNELEDGLPAVLEARHRGLKYFYAGNRDLMSLVAGPDNGPSHKNFGFDVYKYWEWDAPQVLKNIDAVVFYADPAKEPDNPFFRLFREEGFTRDEHVVGGVISSRPAK